MDHYTESWKDRLSDADFGFVRHSSVGSIGPGVMTDLDAARWEF